ncbi:lamin tail domain-containing protein [Iodobacter sp. CM08]|uniref:lamin tail domain-containing protein n=1 Tax=Iodobacter sp. CM08 TaxID=3085902 RepID=UPI002982A443|nr:lamin tail domain-containing protein [Iodobacter sp. CM08]MDW5416087.1 lamin tail domain-containing protein [Iodobacter sp. CM08]
MKAPALYHVFILMASVALTACGGGGGGGDSVAPTPVVSAVPIVVPTATPSPPPTTSVPLPTAVPTFLPSSSPSPTLIPTLAPTPSPTPSPVPTAVPITAANAGLLISEVSSNDSPNAGAWLEIHNPSSSAVSLSGVSLRTRSGLRSAPFTVFSTPVSFSLPAVTLAAGAYLVVIAKIDDSVSDNSQVAYIKNGEAVPFWDANGAIELTFAGATLDFVRFGNSSQAPLSSSAWAGANVAAMPATAQDYGKSLVRPFPLQANSNSAADWSLVSFATPGGRNDVPASAVDSDNDGIPDSAEVAGGTFAGLDLYAMGARANQRDIFVQVDHMISSDAGITPRKEALQKVTDAFAARGFSIHFDTGSLYAANFNPGLFNLGGGLAGGSNTVKYAKCLSLDSKTGCASLYSYKSASLDIRRKTLFHYLIMANSQELDGSAGSSGIAEVNGNDSMVTLGSWGLSIGSGSNTNLLLNYQASTIMHELGHNFGLEHGGNESNNYKPNYYSIMNYLYQLPGLGSDAKTNSAVQRYYLNNNLLGFSWGGICNIDASPCGTDYKMDYSDGSGVNLNENSLIESAIIGRGNNGGFYADWNANGSQNANPYSRDINQDFSFSVLSDYNDWANLNLAFARQSTGNSGASLLLRRVFLSSHVLSQDRQAVVLEQRPSSELIRLIATLRGS